MTGEEMERAIEFLLQSQANYESRLTDISARQDRTDAQIAETGRQLAIYAQTQSEFIRSATESITGLAAAQTRTDAKLDRLIGLFEQHIIAAH
jgi:ribosomal protein S12 methylthiotransferase accessory factor YcaO